MKELVFCLLLIVGLLWLMVESAEEEGRQEAAFQAALSAEFDTCIAEGQSRWTCESYRSSKNAERQAAKAKDAADSAATMSAVSMGISAGQR